MKKPEIAKQWARRSGVSAAEAADRLDGVVTQILVQLRKGREAPVRGFGKFRIGPDGRLIFEREEEGRIG